MGQGFFLFSFYLAWFAPLNTLCSPRPPSRLTTSMVYLKSQRGTRTAPTLRSPRSPSSSLSFTAASPCKTSSWTRDRCRNRSQHWLLSIAPRQVPAGAAAGYKSFRPLPARSRPRDHPDLETAASSVAIAPLAAPRGTTLPRSIARKAKAQRGIGGRSPGAAALSAWALAPTAAL